jgi:hypothetical protein
MAYSVLKFSIGRANEHQGKWTAVEDSKLKDVLQTHGGNNWSAVDVLFPGQVENSAGADSVIP